MKKILSYLFTFTAILLFLASSTGVSFIVHHCSENKTSEVHLFVSDYKCQHEKNEQENCCSTNSKSNCTKFKHNTQCCSNKKGFIKIVDKYNISRESFTFELNFISEFLNFSFSNNHNIISNFLINYHGPPKFLGGQEVIKLISVFLI